jgi:hypothetical protein
MAYSRIITEPSDFKVKDYSQQDFTLLKVWVLGKFNFQKYQTLIRIQKLQQTTTMQDHHLQ